MKLEPELRTMAIKCVLPPVEEIVRTGQDNASVDEHAGTGYYLMKSGRYSITFEIPAGTT
jgi:hypothetical protein